MFSQTANLWAIFLTGLLTGGLSCLAVQGGLLATTLVRREEKRLEEKTKRTGDALPIIAFLVTKLFAYTFLGFLLGWFGSFFQLSLAVRTLMQFLVVVFMLGTALNILDVHPIFRYFVIQPPKFLTRLVRNQSKSDSLFSPALLGFFTVFIPCGTTQAMMALAIGSGNPLMGSAILFAFVLGTSPLFFLLGYFATKLGETLHQKFMKIAAYGLILLAVFNLNSTLALSGSDLTIGNLANSIWCTINICEGEVIAANTQTLSETTIEFKQDRYSPNFITVRSDENIRLNLINTSGQGCIQAFTIPKLGIQKIVRIGTQETVEFKAPSEKGQLKFMCGMGMYEGIINVI
ncbi:sulfite exporter TauE/SafE family protein [Candidatus Microgenomates bacterium]|nr:sulfite exporter TauE/SafE family protein [Candidatus Microgenomates bacterium]